MVECTCHGNRTKQPLVQQNIPITTTQPTIEVALTCTYCQQVGHDFKNYPFVDDKMKRLMIEELKTSLHPMVLSTPITHVGVLVQQTRPQPNLVSQHLGWPQPITP